jgi:hypothetical protein
MISLPIAGSRPVYNALGGPWGKGHVTFNGAQSQFLDAGIRTLDIASNGGFTIVAVVRFKGYIGVGEYESIIDFANGTGSNISLFRRKNTNTLHLQAHVGSLKICEISGGMIKQGEWETVVARYDASLNSLELARYSTVPVNNEPSLRLRVVYVGNALCSAVLTDRTLTKSYLGKSNSLYDAYLNADVAGVFVIDTYLSTAAAFAVEFAMTRSGKELTGSDPVDGPSCIPTDSVQGKVRNQILLEGGYGKWGREAMNPEWGRYLLKTCPNGYSMKTLNVKVELAARQECQKCNEELEYILDPNSHDCQRCPPGLKCYGNNITIPKLIGSEWSVQPPIRKLDSCPKGFKISPALKVLNGSLEKWDPDIHGPKQECVFCEEGMECTLDRCFNCTICEAGKYKDTAGTSSCRKCAAGKYNTKTMSVTESLCVLCPQGADTRGLEGAWSIDHCECVMNMYMTQNKTGPNGMQCFRCPAAAICPDGSCGLRYFPEFKCSGIGSDRMPNVAGTWIRDSNERYMVIGCPVGHQLINQTGYEMQSCFQCPEGKYISRSNDPTSRCFNCPPSAVCPNRGPPVFPESKINIDIGLEGALPSEHMLKQWISAAIFANPDLVAIVGYSELANARRSRRQKHMWQYADEKKQSFVGFKRRQNSAQCLGEPVRAVPIFTPELSASITVKFIIWDTSTYAEKLELCWDVAGSNMSQAMFNLIGNSTNFVWSRLTEVSTRPPNEVWEDVDGVLIVRACPMGYLLMNTTIDTQYCFECEGGSYTLDMYSDCRGGVCGKRECTGCPVGVECSPGRELPWKHFVPKLLKIGPRTVNWATIKGVTGNHRINSSKYYIYYNNVTGEKSILDGETPERRGNSEDYVWEYVLECNRATQPCNSYDPLPRFYLRTCPRGSQLKNTTIGKNIFLAEAQRCDPCGPLFYIVDPASGGTCQECPKGALCPDGDLFIPLQVGSEWEIVYSGPRLLDAVKRLVSCPPGYYRMRKEEYPLEDECLKCDANTYLLDQNNFSACLACPVGADCPGGAVVVAREGFWKQPDNWTNAALADKRRRTAETLLFLNEGCTMYLEYKKQYLNFTSDPSVTSTAKLSLLAKMKEHLQNCKNKDCQQAKSEVGCHYMSAQGFCWLERGQRYCAESVSVKSGGGEWCNTEIPKFEYENNCDGQGAMARWEKEFLLNLKWDSLRPRPALIHRCPPKICDKNNVCKQNRTGPACGMCPEGWSDTSDGCQECPAPDDPGMLQLQIAVFFGGGFLALLGYIWASWSPLMYLPDCMINKISLMMGVDPNKVDDESDEESESPDGPKNDRNESSLSPVGASASASNPQASVKERGVERFFSPIVFIVKMIAGMITKVFGGVASLAQLAQRHKLSVHAKIFIGYIQIIGSFGSLDLQLPQFINDILNALGTILQFDFVALPKISCLWAGISFPTKLILMTAGPVAVAMLLWLPVFFYRLRVLCSGWSPERRVKYETLKDGFYSNILFMAFLIYPISSLTSLQTFSCHGTLGLLNSDLRMKCPSFFSFLGVYSLLCILVFPVGIPYFVLRIMKSMKVPEIARDKNIRAGFFDMVGLFIKINSTLECKLMARMVGTIEDDVDEYARRVEYLYR